MDEIRAGFSPALPRIPYALMEQAIALFRRLMAAGMDGHPLDKLDCDPPLGIPPFIKQGLKRDL